MFFCNSVSINLWQLLLLVWRFLLMLIYTTKSVNTCTTDPGLCFIMTACKAQSSKFKRVYYINDRVMFWDTVSHAPHCSMQYKKFLGLSFYCCKIVVFIHFNMNSVVIVKASKQTMSVLVLHNSCMHSVIYLKPKWNDTQ